MEPSDSFFAGSRYAVFGARAKGRIHGGVLIAALNKAGKQAVAIEADGAAVKGALTSRTLAEAGDVSGVVLLPPSPWDAQAEEFTVDAVRQCKEQGAAQVWIYTDGDPSAAVAIAAKHGIGPVSGRCPCLHIEGAGFPHGLHRWMLKVTKKL